MSTFSGLLFLCFLFLGALVTPALAIASIRYHVLPFVGVSYFFWAIASFYNFSLLGGIAIPPLLGGSSRFIPFLIYPASIAIAVAGIVTIGIALFASGLRTNLAGKVLLALAFNTICLSTFLPLAQFHSSAVITEALLKHKPDCVHINSFLSSLARGGEDYQFTEHALFTEMGKTYFWSYSELDFFEGNDRLNINFPCVFHPAEIGKDVL